MLLSATPKYYRDRSEAEVQSAVNYLLYYTPSKKTTSIRTQLDALYGHS
jgi:hypothetical protein